MIRTTAVIPDTPSELGEDQDNDLIRGVVLFQVLHKRVQGAREFSHQAWMRRDLTGMRVVAAVLGVENACAQPCQVHARHVPEAFSDGVFGVLYRGSILYRSLFQHIGAFEHIRTGMAEVVQHWPSANGWRIHLLEQR